MTETTVTTITCDRCLRTRPKKDCEGWKYLTMAPLEGGKATDFGAGHTGRPDLCPDCAAALVSWVSPSGKA